MLFILSTYCATKFRVISYEGTRASMIDTETLSPQQQSNDISRSTLHTGRNLNLNLVWIKTEEKPHFHENDIIVIILEGKGTLYLGGKTVDLKKGDIVFIPQKVEHYFVNKSSKPTIAISISP